jgi:hypothetical protein
MERVRAGGGDSFLLAFHTPSSDALGFAMRLQAEPVQTAWGLVVNTTLRTIE